ncbi:hypothetical protein DAEQUDRAFT_738720 [Daedalea quercina L-15889]|uniref:F-box domain-containing protein n=1 Tax=Daedalea quercina L-15889 TaxID=1314783 RepID=A0A165PQG5_9APHY|nr:hypothetical protein DAEQUDRAFT_738720 [Daedalea quercina L-15889]
MADARSMDVVAHTTTTEGQKPSPEVTHPQVPQVPLEIWEQVFDRIAIGVNINALRRLEDPSHAALIYCALVCKDWYYLTWFHFRRHVTLRDRMDVVWLSQTLRQRPRLREVVRLVKIQGTRSEPESGRGQVQHLGTFAVMLAGRLPNLETIFIEHAEFTPGSVRMENITYLASFHSVTMLAIGSTTFASISQLARLVSVLLACRDIWWSRVDCAPMKYHPLTLLPFNHANIYSLQMHPVETLVMDISIRISEACQLRYLYLTIDVKADESSAVSKIQALLNASAGSLASVWLHVNDDVCPTLPINEAAHAAVGKCSSDTYLEGEAADRELKAERHCNLSQHTSLQWLAIVLDWHDASALSWVAPVLSFVTSEHVQQLIIRNRFRSIFPAVDVKATLTRLENLVQLDEILQHERFLNILPRRIRFEFRFADAPLKERKASLTRFREEHFAWFNELIRQKMPRSCQRD